MYCVYIHQNKINGKIYVGYSEEPHNRWRKEKNDAFNPKTKGYNYILSRAIRKYGWDNFEHIIIKIYDSKEEALLDEKFWISELKTNVTEFGSDFGYNMNEGGNIPPSQKGKKRSKEHREIMAKTQFKPGHRLFFTEEQIEEIKKDNKSINKIAKKFGVARSTIYQIKSGNW